MVDAQVRPLRAFEEDPLSPLDGGVQPGGRVADERGEPLPMSLVFREQSLGIDPLAPAKGVDDALLDRDDRLEFRAERFRVDQVAHADPEAPDLVFERGPDASESRPRAEASLQPFLQAI